MIRVFGKGVILTGQGRRYLFGDKNFVDIPLKELSETEVSNIKKRFKVSEATEEKTIEVLEEMQQNDAVIKQESETQEKEKITCEAVEMIHDRKQLASIAKELKIESIRTMDNMTLKKAIINKIKE
jgi:hypothetical protein